MGQIIFIGGPSGTGKSTISELLVETLRGKSHKCIMIEGDEYHPKSNIEKMSNNIPLTDEDRLPWLNELIELSIQNYIDFEYVVISCSMLKKSYRDLIKSKLVDYNLHLIILSNTFDNVLQQMKKRSNHFFKESMLKSQYDTFEKPDKEKNVLVIECNEKSPVEIVEEIENYI